MSDGGSTRDYHDTPAVAGEVACRLTEAEAADRADWVEAELLPHLQATEEVEDGFVLVLEHTDAALEAAATAVVLESRCCADNGFTLDVPADGDAIRLELTGPDGTKELARAGFFDRFEAVPDPG